MSQLTVENPAYASRFLGLSISALIFLIVGAGIGGTAPQCTEYKHHVPPFTYSKVQYRPPQYCWSTYSFVPVIGVLGVTFGALTYTSLMQLAKTRAPKASTTHFQCIIVWGLSLTGIALVLSFENAVFSLLNEPKTRYECEVSIKVHQDHCHIEQGVWQVSLADLKKRSQSSQRLFAAASWLWLLYCIFTIVILSRLKYWCSSGCKKDCSHCVGRSATDEQSDGCDSCVCCLYPPDDELEQVGIPLVAVSTVQPNLTIDDCEVGLWLKKDVGLPQYFDNFAQNGYERMDAVLYGIDDETDLRQVVPEILPGHVILILKNLDLKRKGSMAFGSGDGPVTGGAVATTQDEKA